MELRPDRPAAGQTFKLKVCPQNHFNSKKFQRAFIFIDQNFLYDVFYYAYVLCCFRCCHVWFMFFYILSKKSFIHSFKLKNKNIFHFTATCFSNWVNVFLKKRKQFSDWIKMKKMKKYNSYNDRNESIYWNYNVLNVHKISNYINNKVLCII